MHHRGVRLRHFPLQPIPHILIIGREHALHVGHHRTVEFFTNLEIFCAALGNFLFPCFAQAFAYVPAVEIVLQDADVRLRHQHLTDKGDVRVAQRFLKLLHHFFEVARAEPLNGLHFAFGDVALFAKGLRKSFLLLH